MRLRADRNYVEQLDNFWAGIGRRSALTFSLRRYWLYRRVESIELLGASAVRRKVSVDLELPKHLPSLEGRGEVDGCLVPISVLAKWPPLMDFNLFGAEEHPASLYAGDTNVSLSYGLLIGLIEVLRLRVQYPNLVGAWRGEFNQKELDAFATVVDTVLPPDVLNTLPRLLLEQLAFIVAQDKPGNQQVAVATRALRDELRPELSSGDDSVARDAGEAVDLASQLGNSSILWVPLRGTPGSDRIVKFSYVDPWETYESVFRRCLIACSWSERSFWIPLPHAGLHTRYHLDISAPEGLEVTGARASAFVGAKTQTRVRSFGGPVGQAVINDDRVHIYLPFRDTPSHRMFLTMRLAASRNGFVRACLVTALLLALVMTVAFGWLSEVTGNIDATVVLLAVIPPTLGYVLVRPAAHELERYQVAGVTIMALIAGAAPIAAALVLVFTHLGDRNDVSLLQPVWAGLLILNWAVVAGLVMSWLFAATPIHVGGGTGNGGGGPDLRNDRRAHKARSDTYWQHVVTRGGVLLAIGVITGSILVCQPYAHVARGALRDYLRDHRAVILTGLSLVAVGALGLYAVTGGLWRILRRPQPDGPRPSATRSLLWTEFIDGCRIAVRRTQAAVEALVAPVWGALQRRRKAAKGRALGAVLIGSGVAWVWMTLISTSLTAWQTLAASHAASARRYASFARAIDVVANATLVPATIFVVVASVWLLTRWDLLEDPLERFSVAVSGILAVVLIAIRGISLLWPAVGHVPPQWPWIGFAAWVGVVSLAIRAPLGRRTPAQRL
jgi:hypothetical protein